MARSVDATVLYYYRVPYLYPSAMHVAKLLTQFAGSYWFQNAI
jgi:hypothetical protein